MHVIEEASGTMQTGILPQAIRSGGAARPAAAAITSTWLEYRADQQETTVSGVLARELDGIASAHIEELSAALPGFAEADGVAGRVYEKGLSADYADVRR